VNTVNSITQIINCESTGTFAGLCRYVWWQGMKLFNRLPKHLILSNSKIYSYKRSGSGPLVYWMGKYDFNNMSFIQEYLKEVEGKFIDVGANIGVYSLLASEIENVLVFSFEPHPVTFEQLKTNIDLNHRKNIFPFQLAISNYSGRQYLTDSPESAINRIVNDNLSDTSLLAVDSMTLDKALVGYSTDISYLKIDVEGHEFEVLFGSTLCLGKIPILQIESDDQERVKGLLRHYGYEGPYYINYLKKAFQLSAQKRAEDPVYFLPELTSVFRKMGWRIISAMA